MRLHSAQPIHLMADLMAAISWMGYAIHKTNGKQVIHLKKDGIARFNTSHCSLIQRKIEKLQRTGLCILVFEPNTAAAAAAAVAAAAAGSSSAVSPL